MKQLLYTPRTHIGGAEVQLHSFISTMVSFMLWPLLEVGPILGMNILEKKEHSLPVPGIELRTVCTAACENEIRMELIHNS